MVVDAVQKHVRRRRPFEKNDFRQPDDAVPPLSVPRRVTHHHVIAPTYSEPKLGRERLAAPKESQTASIDEPSTERAPAPGPVPIANSEIGVIPDLVIEMGEIADFVMKYPETDAVVQHVSYSEVHIADVAECVPGSTDDAETAAGIDGLANDLEKGFEHEEAEFAGKLVLGLMLELETGVPDVDDEMPPHAVILEAVFIKLTNSLPESPEDSYERVGDFTSYVERLEPAKAAEVTGIIEVLGDLIEATRTDVASSEIEQNASEVKLRQLTQRLFEVLGIESDEAMVVQFLEIVAREKLAKNYAQKAASIEYLNETGTHEYKPYRNGSLVDGIAHAIQQTFLAHVALGRYTLQFAMS